jgi:PAS domain S-box-containing protein
MRPEMSKATRQVRVRSASVLNDHKLEAFIEVLDALPHYALVIDEDHTILAANTASRRDLGQPGASLIGQTCTRVVHGQDEAHPDCPLGKADGGCHENLVEERGCWLRAAVYPLGYRTRAGKRIYLHTAKDVTAEQRARLKQAEAELRFRTIFEGATEGIIVTDPEARRVTQCNEAFARMLGYDEQEVLQLIVADLHQEEDLQRVIEVLLQVSTGELSRASDVPFLHKDGSVRCLDASGGVLQFDGTPCIVMFFSDNTERRQMRLQLAQSDRMASLGLLAAGVAHEINNPLTYVLHNLDSLALDLQRALQGSSEAGTLHDLAQQAREAVEGAHHIKQIVKELRTFSRVDENRRVPVALAEVLDGAIRMASHEIKYRARLVKDYRPVPTITSTS